MTSNEGPFSPRNLGIFGLGLAIGGVLGGLLMLPVIAALLSALLILAVIAGIISAIFQAEFMIGLIGWLALLLWGAVAGIINLVFPEDKDNPQAGRWAWRLGVTCGAVLVYGFLYLRKNGAA